MNIRQMLVRSFCMSYAALLTIAWAGSAVAAQCTLGIMANLPVTMQGLRASVPTKINGEDTRFWLDSGAFFSVMSKAKAIELGLSLKPAPAGFYLIGIGGSASTEIATIKSFGIVGQEIKNIEFLVGGSDAGNGLIGRNILALADTEFDLANGSVKLIKTHDCGKASLAYWTAGKPFFTVPLITGSNPRDHIFRLPVTINGTKIEAELDTGAPTSLLSRRAAERAGIDFSAPGVIPSSGVSGFGRRLEKGWVVPVASVGIGDEEILNTKLEVIDNSIASGSAPDMLLGIDFILAHHIYVARDQRRIYLTYSGGKSFVTEQSADVAARSAPFVLPAGKTRVEAVTNLAAAPKTAEEFARRGNARLTGREFQGAIADLTEAIRLSPSTAAYYGDRARIHSANGEAALSAIDLDRALDLDPDDGDLLRVRAGIRLAQKNKPGALADVEAAARVIPPSSLGAIELAVLFEHLGLPARAIPMFDAVIAAHRDDARLGRMLNGRCWERALANVDLDKALDDCNRAIKHDGAKADYLDSRGLVYFRKGDFKAAIGDYDGALKLSPNLAWSLYMRGLTKITLGQADAGKADQAAARVIRPNIVEEATGYGIGR